VGEFTRFQKNRDIWGLGGRRITAEEQGFRKVNRGTKGTEKGTGRAEPDQRRRCGSESKVKETKKKPRMDEVTCSSKSRGQASKVGLRQKRNVRKKDGKTVPEPWTSRTDQCRLVVKGAHYSGREEKSQQEIQTTPSGCSGVGSSDWHTQEMENKWAKR